MSKELMNTQLQGRDESLLKFSAPDGKTFQTKENYANSFAVNNVVSTASHTFRFQRDNGESEEKIIFVGRPPGSGFIVMLQDLYYAFTNSGASLLTERPLGQFLVDIGIREDNLLVCKVRLTDINADDPVLITVSAGVLFYN